MIEELKKLQKKQKAMAKEKGSFPKDKVIEECCEVLIDHCEGKDTTDEEIDLLMCLIDKYWDQHVLEGFAGDLPVHGWMKKLKARGREATTAQRDFLYQMLHIY